MVTVMMVVMDKRMDEMDKRLMTETAPAGQINQVELGASDVLLAKGVGVDHLYIQTNLNFEYAQDCQGDQHSISRGSRNLVVGISSKRIKV